MSLIPRHLLRPEHFLSLDLRLALRPPTSGSPQKWLIPLIREEEWTSTGLIPLNENALVIGHNISYDRVRARNGYSLTETLNPKTSTSTLLSAHIAVSGLAAGQRWLYVIANKEPGRPERRGEAETGVQAQVG